MFKNKTNEICEEKRENSRLENFPKNLRGNRQSKARENGEETDNLTLSIVYSFNNVLQAEVFE